MKKYLSVFLLLGFLVPSVSFASTQYLSIIKNFIAGGGVGDNGEASTATCGSQFSLNKSTFSPGETMTYAIEGNVGNSTEGTYGGIVRCDSNMDGFTFSIQENLTGNSTTGSNTTIRTAPATSGTYTIPLALDMYYRDTRNSRSGTLPYTVSATSPSTPSLNLNARSAFLNLFTPTFAQEDTQKSQLIADVEIRSNTLTSQNGNILTVDVDLQNQLGTQKGILYGLQIYRKEGEQRTLLDSFVIQDPLTLNQGETVTKTITYIPPQSVGGEVEVFTFAKSNTGILLASSYVGMITLPQAKLSLSMSDCMLTGNTLSCTLSNQLKDTQTGTLTTSVKRGNDAFGTLVTLMNTPLTLKGGTTIITQELDPKYKTESLYLETTLLDTAGYPITRTGTPYNHPTPKVNIDNVLIKQTGKKTYEVTAVILHSFRLQTPHTITASLYAGDILCGTATTPLNTEVGAVNTVIPLKLDRVCEVARYTVILNDEAGNVVVQDAGVYENAWVGEGTGWQNWLYIGIAILIALAALVLSRKK